MTENEINISNLSYVNKDFNTIFPELLDLVGELTNRWDPSTSNESDPGVVLMKLMAIIADKNNYNIDKNVLESFPLSVTQTGNARKLYDILGYSMNWYRSASTTVQLYWNNASDFAEGAQITLPKFDTMLTTDEGDIVYTLVEDVTLTYDSRRATSVQCLQGVVQDYEINGTTIITLDNLDENRRIYFTETQIAQNGIYVYNYVSGEESYSDWTRVDNLEIQESKSRVYKFGVLPNSNTCYIEFPLDIASIIGSGVCIKYLISSGVDGNIKAGALTTFYSENQITVDNYTPADETTSATISPSEAIDVKNDSSATNGQDPETLNEAYNNYKRTVGTFDTLVSCRDYDNYTYNLEDDTAGYLVSNVITSDRTNDLNFTDYLVTLLSNGVSYKQLIKDDNYAIMTAYDVCLRLLEYVLNITNESSYNRTFSVNDNYEVIETEIDDSKCISHEYFNVIGNTYSDKPFIFKNFYKLVGNIITYYKVSSTEATEIENNIKLALMQTYNARGVNFGEPIIYDDLITTIQSADTRIKTVILNEPEYELKYITNDDFVGDYTHSKEFNIELKKEYLAKLVASGNVQLFDFDLEFRYDFGQTVYTPSGGSGSGSSTGVYNGISAIETILSINDKDLATDNPDIPNDAGYTLKANENIRLMAPNLYTETSYGGYVNYRWVSGSAASKANTFGPATSPEASTYSCTAVMSGTNKITFTITVTNAGSEPTHIIEEGTYVKNQYNAITITVRRNNTDVTFEATQGEDSLYTIPYTYSIAENVTLTFILIQQNAIEDSTITADTEYQLQNGDALYIQYTDSNDANVSVYYGPGTIIRPSMDLVDINYATRTVTKNYTYNTGSKVTGSFITMSASESIEIRAINEQVFDTDTLYCIWFTNNSQRTQTNENITTVTYTLFQEPDSDDISNGYQEKILQNGEYFLYTNSTQDVLYILGSGTKISRKVNGGESAVVQTREESSLTLTSINNNGLASITETSWYTYSRNKLGELAQTEMQIITLGEGAKVCYYEDNGIRNYYYKASASDSSWTQATILSGVLDIYGKNLTWRYEAILNINSTTSTPQALSDKQSVLLYTNGATKLPAVTITGSAENSTYLVFNSDLSLTGGDIISTEVTMLNGNASYALSAYAFNAASNITTLRPYGEYKQLSFSASNVTDLTSNYTYSFIDNGKYIIPVFGTLVNTSITLNNACKLFTFDSYSTNATGARTLNSDTSGKAQYIVVTGTGESINIFDSWTATPSSITEDDSEVIQIGNIYRISNFKLNGSTVDNYGVSEQITNTLGSENVASFISTTMANDKYSALDVTYLVPDIDAINTELYDTNGDVFAPTAIWDSNNLIGRFTIPQMKTDVGTTGYNIKIASSSRS